MALTPAISVGFTQARPSVISKEDPFPRKRIDVLDSFLATIDLDQDAGSPVVFLHGNPTHSYVWRNVIRHVRGLGRIVAPDLIGMGASGRPAIAYRFFDHARYLDAFLNALQLDQITFVAHDWGVALALHWMTRNESRVRGIAMSEGVLAPTPTWEDFPPGGRATFRAFRTPGVGEAMILDNNHFIERSLPAAILRSLAPEELCAYRQPFRKREDRLPMLVWPRELPIAGEPADVVSVVETSLRALCNSPIPKLLLTGDPGALVKRPLVEWCKLNIPSLEIASVGPSIHYPQEDQPEAFGTALAEWLKRQHSEQVSILSRR